MINSVYQHAPFGVLLLRLRSSCCSESFVTELSTVVGTVFIGTVLPITALFGPMVTA